MRRSFRRLRTTLRWTGTVAAIAACGIWLVTFSLWFDWRVTQRVSIGCSTGVMYWSRLEPPPDGPLSVTRGRRGDPAPMRWWFGSHDMFSGGIVEVWIPLWFPTLLLALPTALAWRTHLKHRAPNACPNCGYDRSGIPEAAPCPECGTGSA